MDQIAIALKRAKNSIALFATIFLLGPVLLAQQNLPIIKATSKKVDVQDGVIFRKGVWNLSPEVKPDVYYVLGRSPENKVTFYTDIDSISFIVKPGNRRDFIILLNGRDTCYTQILAPVPEIIGRAKPKLVQPALLQQDLISFRDSLQRLHAGLYRYRNKAEMDALFDSCFGALNSSMTEIEFFRTTSFLISALEDGHTQCALPAGIINYFKDSVKMFPLQTRFIDNKAYVPCDTKELEAGTEIIAIDNKPMAEIRKQFFRYLPSDGSIQSGKYAKMNDGHDPFCFMYYIVYGEKPAFTVEYKTAAGKHGTTILQACLFKNVQCPPSQSKPEKYLQLDYTPSNVAILTIKSFLNNQVSTVKEDFRSFLQSSFTDINNKKSKALVIDLRNNGGGDDELGALLYSYLTDKPFRYFTSIETATRAFKESDHPGLAIQKAGDIHFTGTVYFLINGNSFSTTADFCSIAKSNARGKFIGEETGGGYYGNTSGARATIFLPNTKIRVNIPLDKYVNAVKKSTYKDRGTIPDYLVIPTISDVIQHKDVQLDYALKLAEKH